MERLHRSVARRVKKVDVNNVANAAEDFIHSYSAYRAYLSGVPGLVKPDRLRALIRKIDEYEKEILSLEEKIERLAEKRAVEAVKLEDYLSENLDIVKEYLSRDEYRDFWR